MTEQERFKGLWPTYALRAWLTALVTQVRTSRDDVAAQIGHFEHEIARLRGQLERSDEVMRSLGEVIELVDDRLRRVRDSESYGGPAVHEKFEPKDEPAKHEPLPEPAREHGSHPPEKPGKRPGQH